MSRPSRNKDQDLVTPSLLLRAYACGIFPMADSADDPTLYWVEPELRGVLPLDGFHVPRRLARTVRSDRFEIRVDSDFEAVIAGCAAPRRGRPRDLDQRADPPALRRALPRRPRPHRRGLARGAAGRRPLRGEARAPPSSARACSPLERDASKVALVHLVARLRRGGFRLLDAQFLTSHLQQFGAVEVPRDDYVEMLDDALAEEAEFRVRAMRSAARRRMARARKLSFG